MIPTTEKLKYEKPAIRKMNAGLMNKFGTRTEYAPVKTIDGVPVRKLIQQYGSPCFVLSERTIRRTYQQAVRAFKTRYPKVQYAWSYKTNYIDAVCKVFHQEGAWAEVVSGFEYQKAIDNGVPGNRIFFNGPDKSREELKTAVENDSYIHIDHFDELYELMDIMEGFNKKAKVAIRMNMDVGVYPLWDRFGFNYESYQAWNAITKIMSSDKLELVGLHSHIGTFMLSTAAYGVAASKMCDLAMNIKLKWGKMVEYLDLGGGFASTNTLRGSYLPGTDISPSFDDYAEVITSTILNYGFEKNELPMLVLESGRALIDDAGYLLGSVLANKRLADGRRATIMDFGVNILFTAFWYEHKISPAQDFSHHTEEQVVYGPLCMNIDLVRESVNLPLLNKGDQVVVHKVGAYNMTQWMQFIQMRPKVIMIDQNDEPHIIRENETIKNITEPERMPAHLVNFKPL